MMIDLNKPVLRLTPRPNEANPRGDIFGGWLMSQLDLAGMLIGARYVESQFATVAVKEMTFHCPIFPFDEVSIFGRVIETGNSSFTVGFEVYVTREGDYDAEPILASKAAIIYATIKQPGVKNENAMGS